MNKSRDKFAFTTSLWLVLFPIACVAIGLTVGIFGVHKGEHFLDRFLFAMIPASFALILLILIQLSLLWIIKRYCVPVTIAISCIALLAGIQAVHIVNF